MKLRNLFAVVALSFASASAFASVVTLEMVKAKFPGTKIQSVQEVKDFPGVYEMVVSGNKIFYLNRNLDKMMIGHIFDLKTRADETQARIEALTPVRKIDFNSLPIQKNAIKVVKGNGKRVFAVFSDPKCPYCRALEKEIDGLNDYTMYVIPMPIINPKTKEELHKGSVNAAKKIWCSKDKYAAWHKFLGDQVSLNQSAACKNPIENNIKLGEQLQIGGTPTIVSSSGVVHGGFLPVPQLNLWLNKYSK